MRVLTSREQHDEVRRRADQLYERLLHDEDVILGESARDPLMVEADRCARSRLALRDAVDRAREQSGETSAAIELSVVWAMYRETGRIQPYSQDDNPGGEDFLREKVRQMDWLMADVDVPWNLVAVDDGCPERPSSGDLAEKIIAADGLDRAGKRVEVLRLDDLASGREALADEKLGGIFARLNSTDDSRKGGSILYGLASQLERSRSFGPDDRHVMIYTDADLSTNLAQAGLLAAPILDGAAAAAGQRYGADNAVLVTKGCVSIEPESTGSKPDNMIILFRHYIRQFLLPSIAHIFDTQAGFKAIEARELRNALRRFSSLDETFDVELLYRLLRDRPEGRRGLSLVPIVFVEDFEHSNFPSVTPGQRHLDMIKQLVSLYERLEQPRERAKDEVRDVLNWITELTLAGYVAVIEHLKERYEPSAREIVARFRDGDGLPFDLDELRRVAESAVGGRSVAR